MSHFFEKAENVVFELQVMLCYIPLRWANIISRSPTIWCRPRYQILL